MSEKLQIKARITEEQKWYLDGTGLSASAAIGNLIDEKLLKEGKCLHCSNEAEHTITIFDKTKFYDVCDKCYCEIDNFMRKAKTSENSEDGYRLKLDEVE